MRKHVATPRRNLILVACSHVEIDSGKVALILVVRFENLSRISRKRASTNLAEAAMRFKYVAISLAKRQVATTIIHIAIGRNHMYNIRVHRLGIVKPALRKRVLTIVHVAFFRVVACMTFVRVEVGNVGIHVPNLAI